MCVWGPPHFSREGTFGSKEAGDTSGIWPAGIPPCFPGPPGAWVPASWIWDSGVEGQSGPDLIEVPPQVPRALLPLTPRSLGSLTRRVLRPVSAFSVVGYGNLC